MGIGERDRCQSHDRAVARFLGIGRERLLRRTALERGQSVLRLHADVEAGPGAAQVTVAPPADVALELVDGIEAAALTRLSARHSAMLVSSVHWPGLAGTARRRPCRSIGSKVPGRLELERRAERVAGGEPEHGAAIVRAHVRGHSAPRSGFQMTGAASSSLTWARLKRSSHAAPPLVRASQAQYVSMSTCMAPSPVERGIVQVDAPGPRVASVADHGGPSNGARRERRYGRSGRRRPRCPACE